jgi:uncharacterized membrane protein
MAGWALAAAGLALLAYSVLSWALMTWAPNHAWTVLALFGPLLIGLGLAGLQRRHGPTLLACAVLAVVLGLAWQRGGVDVNRLYVLQHAGIHALLGWVFAITLRPGGKALITTMAERVHPEPLSPGERVYTRALTRAWVVFFAGMVVASLSLYALAPWSWWSFFSTVLTPVAAGSFFVVEYVWRRWRHPDFMPVSMRRAMQAWRDHGKQESA